MQTLSLPTGQAVTYYTDLDEFPAERRSWLTRYQIETAEIDTTTDALADRLGGIMQAYREGRNDHGETALQNLFIALQVAQDFYAPDSLMFGVLIHSVDGVAVTDLSPEGLKPLLTRLAIPIGTYQAVTATVKKNSLTRDSAISLGLKVMN